MASNGEAVDWVSLPQEILQLIAEKLTVIFDYSQFRSVCVSWRNAAGPAGLKQQKPLFVLPSRKDVYISTISFISVADGHPRIALDVSEDQAEFLYGSAYGWLLMISRPTYGAIYYGGTVSLLNPITSVRILLPELPPALFMGVGTKVILCSHPASTQHHQLLVALWGTTQMAFIRQGDKVWTLFNCSALDDIVYFNQKLYLVHVKTKHSKRKVRVFDADSQKLSMLTLPLPDGDPECQCRYRLLESAGDLLLITWTRPICNEIELSIYKLHSILNKKLTWTRVSIVDISKPHGAKLDRISSVYAQSLPDNTGYRLYVCCYTVEPSTCYIQELDVVPGVGCTKQHCHFDPIERANFTKRRPIWMVPTLH